MKQITIRTFYAMDTQFRILTACPLKNGIFSACVKTIRFLESLWSPVDPDSAINRLFRAGEGSLDPLSEKMVRFGLQLQEWSHGSYSLGIAPLLAEAGFDRLAGQREKSHPYDCEKAAVTLQNHRVTLRHGAGLDFGSLCKGAACDLIAELLKANGVQDFLLDFGGTIAFSGKRPDGSPFKALIADGRSKDVLASVCAEEGVLSASSQALRQTTTAKGKTIGHLFDGRTGKCCISPFESVRVFSLSGLAADGLSTMLFVMESEDALQFCQDHTGFEALFIRKDGQILITNGWDDRLTFPDKVADVITLPRNQQAKRLEASNLKEGMSIREMDE